jgi:hypothetical protein
VTVIHIMLVCLHRQICIVFNPRYFKRKPDYGPVPKHVVSLIIVSNTFIDTVVFDYIFLLHLVYIHNGDDLFQTRGTSWKKQQVLSYYLKIETD